MNRDTNLYASVLAGCLFVLTAILLYVNKDEIMSSVWLFLSGLLMFVQGFTSSKNKNICLIKN